MSKVYKCDSCGRTIENPYTEKMKEFYLRAKYDFGRAFPEETKIKIKIHLCTNCYKGLSDIAKRSEQNAR